MPDSPTSPWTASCTYMTCVHMCRHVCVDVWVCECRCEHVGACMCECNTTSGSLNHLACSLFSYYIVELTIIKTCGHYLFHHLIYYSCYSRVAAIQGQCLLSSAWIVESVQMITIHPHSLKQNFKLAIALLQKQSIHFLASTSRSPSGYQEMPNFPGTFSGYMTNNLISLLHAHS